MFLRSCVAQALSRGDGSRLSLQASTQSASSDGHEKRFCTKAITIIHTSQFLKAISAIDKSSPTNFYDKSCGKFSMCLTKFFFLVSQITKVFWILREKRAVHGLCRGIKQREIFKWQQDFIYTMNFAIAPTP